VGETGLRLEGGSRVGVVGAGPAGSFFAYFLLDIAERVGLDIRVEMIESRDFLQPSPHGCNMCGGIVSESLVQNLAAEGIILPATVIQRGIDSYHLHMDAGSVRIETPLQEMRIGAVHRGSGPRDVQQRDWESFDQHLLQNAIGRGARLVRARIDGMGIEEGRPILSIRGGGRERYDLLAVAVGVNSPAVQAFEAAGVGYKRPAVTKTVIREYHLGRDVISRTIGSSMHVFLLAIPRLEFAAVIPKGDYLTVCLLGENIDNALVQAFLDAPEVRRCFPSDWRPDAKSCQCMPSINVRGPARPYADRVVFVGDCGVTRLYKDGIGAAYRTAKAAARTAVFEGISAEAFHRHYEPVCRSIAADNVMGRVAFLFTRVVRNMSVARRAILRMTIAEQRRPGHVRRMSGILWDMFSGSAPYKDIFLRMLRPACAARFAWAFVRSMWPPARASGGGRRHDRRARIHLRDGARGRYPGLHRAGPTGALGGAAAINQPRV
jgi:flavin-dependent dehydrogenase